MSETTTRVYELGFMLVPHNTEDEVSASVATLKDVVTKNDGSIVAEGTPEFIDLAYQMEKDISGKKVKWNQGYFGWLKFEAAPESLEAVKKALDANEALIRYLLVKTSVDNTVIFKKPKMEARRADAMIEELIEEDAADEMIDNAPEMIDDHEKLPNVAQDMAPAEEEESQ